MTVDLEIELRLAMQERTDGVHPSTTFIDQTLAAARPESRPAEAAGRRRTVAGRRHFAAIALGCVALAAPAGVAVATGPSHYRTAYDWLFADYAHGGPKDGPVTQATLRRAATGPGPDSRVFSVVSSSNEAGTTCITPLFESAKSAAEPLPSDVVTGAQSFCRSIPTALPFGQGANLVLVDTGIAVYSFTAGAAVRAELRSDATGQRYPVLFTDGYAFGWMPTLHTDLRGVDEAYTVTGYGADGAVIASGRVLGMTVYDEDGWIVGPTEDIDGRLVPDSRH